MKNQIALDDGVQLCSLKAPSFYWELEIVSYGDTDDDSGPIVSFGFATEAEKRDGAWTNPVGTCLFHKYVPLICHFTANFWKTWEGLTSASLDFPMIRQLAMS